MLTNRQPTLHRPGLMAHRARVLKVRGLKLSRILRSHHDVDWPDELAHSLMTGPC